MSSVKKETMECGTSLAEDVWTVPSTSTLADGGSGLAVGVPPPTGGGGGVSHADHDKGAWWSGIYELRAQLAADIVRRKDTTECDLFPTFVSPYELPRIARSESDRQGPEGSSSASHVVVGQGMRVPLVYCDQTASHRPVHSIEEYIRRTSMPCHANTHTVSCGELVVPECWVQLERLNQ